MVRSWPSVQFKLVNAKVSRVMISQNSQDVHEKVEPIDQIRRGIAAICIPGEAYELRVPEAGKYKVISGNYDNFHKMAFDALNLSDVRQMPAVYVTINPTRKDLLARSYNAAKEYAKYTTADRDIPRLLRLLIDLDVRRPAGISSTDEEHALGILKAEEVRDYLTSRGWPSPVLSDSGNGGHLIFGLDLLNTDDNVLLLKAVLNKLDELFSDSSVKVDTTTYNPSRITKLPGTMARKGDDVPGYRPHRRSYVIEAPDVLEVVPEELLRELAGTEKKVQEKAGAFDRAAAEVLGSDPDVPEWVGDAPKAGGTWTPQRLEEWLATHGVKHKEPVEDGDRLKYVLEHCVFDESHQGKDAAVFITVEGDELGKIGHKCFHDSCSNRTWHEFREKFDPKDARKPNVQENTSWIDALDGKVKGGDGASTVEPTPQEAARPKDSYERDLEADGISVVGVLGGESGGKHYYFVECPRTGLAAAFWRQVGGVACGYESPEGKTTWTEGKALFKAKVNRRTRRAYTIQELKEMPTPTWLIEGHIPSVSTGGLYGPSNIGKSFIALEKGCSVATGKKYLGKFAVQKGAVCYVAGEGFAGIKNRVQAWMTKHGFDDIPDFTVIPYQFDLTGDPEGEATNIVQLCQEKIGRMPTFTIIDTLNKNFGAGNENDTKDMTMFTRALDVIKELTNGAAMTVHHTGKDLEKGPRGNITLGNSVEFMISVEEYNDREGVVIKCRKAKDAAFFAPYVAKSEVVGEGDDSSLVFEYDHEVKEEGRKDGRDKKQQWKDAEEAILHLAPTSEAEAWTKGAAVEIVRGKMKANGCDVIPTEPVIREALESMAHNGKLKKTDSLNKNRVKFYRPQHDSGFGIPAFFGSEIDAEIDPE